MGSFAELFDPNDTYPYFEHAARHPFEPEESEFSLTNSAWLADCALLVYLRETSQVVERLEAAGMSGRCIGFDRPGAQALVAHSPGWAIVSFRGTEVTEWKDIVADARIGLVRRQPHGGRIHQGFYQAVGSIWLEIGEALHSFEADRGAPLGVWFTGHSLGAGMAVLAADRYEGTRGLYTFGAPPVGDEDFRRSVSVSAFRIVNNNDGITALPSSGLSPYRHVGDMRYLDTGGALHSDSGALFRLQEGLSGHSEALGEAAGDFARGDVDEINLDALRDHSPTAYARALWRNVTSQETPPESP